MMTEEDSLLESAAPEKGPMRFITCGPYELTKNKAAGRFDSITFVYAVGVGSIDYKPQILSEEPG
jgi:hypothetical protein